MRQGEKEDPIEYFELPKIREHVKMKTSPTYREDFYIRRNPYRFILDEEKLAASEGYASKLLFSSAVAGTYYGLYFWFVNKISHFQHSKCGYILARNVLPTSLVLFGASYWVADKIFGDKAAARRHYKASAYLRRLQLDESSNLEEDFLREEEEQPQYE